MSKILGIKAREILDSRGNPTVEVELTTKAGKVIASVPSGASTGKYEAYELRDGGKRYGGLGVLDAVNNIRKIIAPRLVGKKCDDQAALDRYLIKLDKTKNKSRLGANAILAVSMAVCRAGALHKDIPLYEHIAELYGSKNYQLPIPGFNVINGGKHAGNKLDIQEFMAMPVRAASFKGALQMGAETYHTLKKIILKKYGKNATNLGDEGGFAPPINKTEEALRLLINAVKKAGYTKKIRLALDCAASEFATKKGYNFEGKLRTAENLKKIYLNLIKKYKIISIEDPFSEEDFAAFTSLTKSIGNKVNIVGDDLLVTNPERIKKAIHFKSCNALLLKINQIGTITEALEAVKLAKSYNMQVMVSHRSGETNDDFIADLAVGINAEFIKSGAPARGERLAKYN